MANPDIQTWFDNPDPDESPLNLQQLFALATRLVHSRVDPQDDFLNVIAQSLPPGQEHHDTLWIELDGIGRPTALKYWFHGKWRRVYNGMIGEVRGFSGAPGYGPAPALFNADGRGNQELAYDGWHICNGKNGVIDLSDKFIIGAHMNKGPNNTHADWDNGWQTWQKLPGQTIENPIKQGGANGSMIQMKNLPPLDTSTADEATGLWIHGKGWKDDAEHGAAFPIVDVNFGMQRDHSAKIATYGADPEANPPIPQEELAIMPPFYCLAWITFVGYENT